jgi:MscS family membrane protein
MMPMNAVYEAIAPYAAMASVQIAATLLVTVVVAAIVRALFVRVILRLTRRTRSAADDAIVALLRGPVVHSVILIGLALVTERLSLRARVDFVVIALLKSAAVVIWGVTAMRIGSILIDALSRQVDRVRWIQPKTVPLAEMSLKLLIVGGAAYFAFVAWRINIATWLASAGIIGIAVGFAAKDTLANLFSGIFILADAPYKTGDFIILDNTIRGVVVDIGIRSTRLLTRDDVEVTVPNAVIASSRIVNETGGPHDKMRVRVKVAVAYGSDVDEVKKLLLSAAEEVEHVVPDPAPRVRFRELGDSGLLFELLAWIEEPVYRGRVVDALNSNVYKILNRAGVEIPYAKHDIYIKEHAR